MCLQSGFSYKAASCYFTLANKVGTWLQLYASHSIQVPFLVLIVPRPIHVMFPSPNPLSKYSTLQCKIIWTVNSLDNTTCRFTSPKLERRSQQKPRVDILLPSSMEPCFRKKKSKIIFKSFKTNLKKCTWTLVCILHSVKFHDKILV